MSHLIFLFFFLVNQWSTLNSKQCSRCGLADGSCSFLHICSSSCGFILSVNYPSNYSDNHRCRWLITAPPDHYINLTINDFDVPSETIFNYGLGDCLFDHVSFVDGLSKKLIGRFCNSNRPPHFIVSSWNKLLIEFNTDSKLTGKGFSFSYKLSQFSLPEKLLPALESSPDACPTLWSYYKGHCYRAFMELESLQWYKAEEKCSEFGKNRDGHLVSILDEKEMVVVYHFLINVWEARPYQPFYIGLIDVSKEGVFRWSDTNPMSYTDWGPGDDLGPLTSEPQPDGGAYEDCTILKLDSSHSTANWHDIPCSLGKSSFYNSSLSFFEDAINGYICKIDALNSNLNSTSLQMGLYNNVIVPNETTILHLVVSEKYYLCANFEVVSILQQCDGIPNCKDETDETQNCPNFENNECLPFQYRCSNGRCISIAATCDFVDDCGDGSDEIACHIRPCKKDEYRCTNGQCIPVDKRCDLLYDCKDQSDEGSICTTKGYCNPETTFQCYYGNCIPLYAVCDRHRDCPGKFHEDEQVSSCYMMSKLFPNIVNKSMSLFQCKSGQKIDYKYKCIYEFDQFGYQIGCRDVSHLRNCEDHFCSDDYVKCSDSYCIPPRYICDGKRDCAGGEDEVKCDEFACPGQYKCINFTSCIFLHQLCDSIRHCPAGDDEWFCDITCPRNCSCKGLFIDCRALNLTQLPKNIPDAVRKLDLSKNFIGPDMSSVDFSSFIDLIELIIQKNQIEILKSRKFISLRNLQLLDLRHNHITIIEAAAFAGLVRVNTLYLEDNPDLNIIEPMAFIDLSKLQSLNISYGKVEKLRANTFKGLSNLQTLEFKYNNLVSIESGTFSSLNSVTVLDLRGNDIREFKRDTFAGLEILQNLYSDSFKFCCLVSVEPFNVPFERCLPPPDEISDCEDLMSSPIQRYFLWILGMTAIIFNLAVIIGRYRTRLNSNKVSSSLILSLGCADFLMGIYLLIIATVDVYYRSDQFKIIKLITHSFLLNLNRGHYIEVSDNWRNSYLCKLCGFLSTISSEASVFTLVFIAIDRLICICFPFSKHKLNLRLTYK